MTFQKLNPTTRLLTVCSARMRPELIMNMLKSFDRTKSEISEMVIYVWEDDPKVEDYRKNLKNRNVIYGKSRFMTEVLNYISTEVYPNVDYYQMINDDHYYLVKDWDKMMIEPMEESNGWGISYCRGIDGRAYPNAEVVSGKIVRALGYYIYPKFRQYGCEPYFQELGEAIGKFFHIEGDIIDHRSVNWGYFESDAVHKFIYSDEETINGQRAIMEWDTLHKLYDLNKIARAMINESKS